MHTGEKLHIVLCFEHPPPPLHAGAMQLVLVLLVRDIVLSSSRLLHPGCVCIPHRFALESYYSCLVGYELTQGRLCLWACPA